VSKQPDCVVAIIHGVGNHQRWSVVEEFQDGLLSFLNRRLRSQAKISNEPAPPAASLDRGYDLIMEPALRGQNNEPDAKLRVRLREINWADQDGRLEPNVTNFLKLMGWLMRCLFRARLRRLFPPGASSGSRLARILRAAFLYFILFGAGTLGLLLALINWPIKGRYNTTARIAGTIMEYLGDVIQMEDTQVRKAINQRLHRQLNDILALDKPRFLVLVSHSLGNVFVLDQLERQLKPAPLPIGWISLGSPLWVIPAVAKKYTPIWQIKLDLEMGWCNLYDPLDPVAGPIQHDAILNKDFQWYRASWEPISAHTSYFGREWHLAKFWEMVAEGFQNYHQAPRVEARSPRNRRPLLLGPHLRQSGPDFLTVWTAHMEPGTHRAELFQEDALVACLEEEVGLDEQLTHYWRFNDLTPDTEYEFRVSWRDHEGNFWPLTRLNKLKEELSRTPTCFNLRTPSANHENLRLMFGSCHYPQHVSWDGDQGMSFVRKVLERFEEKPDSRPHGQIHLGDQIYADDHWKEQLFLPWPKLPERHKARLASYSQVYDRFWRYPEWSELLRQAPAYMMWDDHDVRDGWGNNWHDFDHGRFKPSALEKYLAAREAFELYQTKGNPPPQSEEDFQFTLDMGPASIFVFDPRTHRCYQEPCDFHPFGPDQMERYRAWLAEKSETAQVLIVVTSSPMVFIKRWRLDLAAYKLPGFMRWMERFLHWHGFDDDWRDQMACTLNQKARNAIVEGLAEVLLEHPEGARRAVLVAGDVHVGGFCRIPVGQGREIHQWIASPTSNKPNRPLYMAAQYAIPKRKAGMLRGQQLWAHDFWAKPVRNVLSLSLKPAPSEGLAPLVQGDLLYESGFELKTFSRTLG
jgi:hypothetical protein